MAMTADTAERGVHADILTTNERPKTTYDKHQLLAKHMNGKQEEWAAIADRKKPLELLDLPIDVLQSILREVTHTNDLTSLALTHSALHDLVIPHIYARFDIVWPEANTHVENRIGVDALTYGLATLVMAQDVFGEAPYQQQDKCEQCGHQGQRSKPRSVRRGNHFAQYTKKFSLGNGPPDWVQEYLIIKEGGKMLGTLVALAVGRMRNLETFVWDMPTGVLRDVWLALASLGNRNDGRECRLERVWVRWHDNQEQGPLASPPPPEVSGPSHPNNLPSLLQGPVTSLFQIPPYPRVEFPTFSTLPPLKSLSVLDIDELPYAEEMSILIERSLHRLRELRIGVAQHAQFDMWARPSEDRTFIPVPLMSVNDCGLRPGGILGIIVSQFCDAFSNNSAVEMIGSSSTLGKVQEASTSNPESTEVVKQDLPEENNTNTLVALLSAQSLQDPPELDLPPIELPKRGQKESSEDLTISQQSGSRPNSRDRRSRKLQLEILEIERVYLSIGVLSGAIDWSRLTTLTLLGCRNHEQLWKEMRKRFTPHSQSRTPSSSQQLLTGTTSLFSRRGSSRSGSASAEEYQLKLKRLHTDTVSAALIAFIRDALAPDSLEWLFLQESTSYKSSVTIDTIYKGAIRRHRGSLKKLLIDSEVRAEDDTHDASWKRWIYNRELLSCITSGKMQLRELSMSIDYKDWHFFLQRLPHATTLRSLHISHISEHVHGTVDSREAALQILDIVALRPELELCYLGIQRQCFEILEYNDARKAGLALGGQLLHSHSPPDSDDNDDSHELGHDEESDFEMELSHAEETEDEEADSTPKPHFRLREILFYDDKVSIFKARHGRL